MYEVNLHHCSFLHVSSVFISVVYLELDDTHGTCTLARMAVSLNNRQMQNGAEHLLGRVKEEVKIYVLAIRHEYSVER